MIEMSYSCFIGIGLFMFFMFALLKGASVMQKRELYDESVKSMRNEIRCLFSQLRAEKTGSRQFPDVVARIEAAADKIEKAADRIERAASAIQRSSNKIANSSSIISMLKTLEKL